MELWLAIGFIAGYLLAYAIKRRKPIGTILVDYPDPDEAPCLFLELEKDGMANIHLNKTALFKVCLNGCRTRK